MRIARSSSATRIVALIIRHRLAHSRRRSRPTWRNDRQKHPEHGAPGLAVEFDHAAVIADYLGHQCKTQASSVALGRDERIEQMRA